MVIILTMQEEKQHIHIVISGRVQFVMFRDFTNRMAQKMGLVGTVMNNEDGTVEVYAQGMKQDLDTFIERLHKGSLLSNVESVEVEKIETLGDYKDFVIMY